MKGNMRAKQNTAIAIVLALIIVLGLFAWRWHTCAIEKQCRDMLPLNTSKNVLLR
ncbi:MAG: hypothetical protein Q8P16_01700 [bacterium]|nr:hypothetical protein [bacterium]